MIRVQEQDFDIGAETARLRSSGAAAGAIASFVGLVRDANDRAGVSEMTLEHYPAMTDRALHAIADEARGRWEILDLAIIHRVGTLKPGDQIVLVAVASAHRADAFAACEFIMDYLKTRAPFWKKEMIDGGSRWVASRSSDEESAKRWERGCP